MLQNIRDRSQSWLTIVIIALIVISFALWGVHSYLGGGSSSNVVAKVNGKPITTQQFNAAYERLRQQQQFQLGADFVIDPKAEMRLKKQALDQLIISQMLSQAALKEGYRITMEEVEAALLQIPAFQVNGRFSRDRFNEVLNSILYNENTFLADLQMSMLINQVRSGFINSAFALPDDTEAAIKLVNQTRNLGYLILPVDRFISKTAISEQQAYSYYDQNKPQFTLPEQVSIEYLALSLPQLAAQQHLSDDALKQFYQDNINNYTHPKRWKIATILVRVPEDANAQQIAQAQTKIQDIAQQAQKGTNFATLAERYSDDRLAAKQGGAMDWFSTGMVDPAIEKTVTTLKPGTISQPIRTKYGFTLIKLLAVQQPQVMPFDKVKDQVAKALAHQQAERQFADDSDKLSNLTYANPGSLDVAAKALNLQVKTSELFSRSGGKDEITANPKVVAAAFSSDVLQGNNSAVIDLTPDTLVVLRVKQHKPAILAPFSQVRDEVVEILKKRMAEQQAQTVGRQLLEALHQGKTGQQVAAGAGVSWKTVQQARRYNSQVPAAILQAAFKMPKPAGQTPSFAGFSLNNGDYAVVALTQVSDGIINAKAAKTQRSIYREEIENSYGQLDYASYMRDLVKRTKVVDVNNPLKSDNAAQSDNN